MSNQAAELLRQLAEAPLPVQREVAAAILELQFGGAKERRARSVHIRDIAGKYRPQIMEDAKPHDRWFAEAIHAGKSGEPQP